MIKSFKKDLLTIKVFQTREELGREAAIDAGNKIKELLNIKECINVIFAAAPSQNEFLENLISQEGIDWGRINAFHMDEYVGLEPSAPQGFGNFLKERIFDKKPFRSVNYLDGQCESEATECCRYGQLLSDFPVDIVCMGIGENAHIAFNDPPVADFKDKAQVKVVELDAVCRQQQVNDGCFKSIGQVPTHALTLTIPALTRAKYLFCMVPGKTKTQAVTNTIGKEISELYPATIMRKHPAAVLYVDAQSGALI
ncbi:MAG: glucosamine-6-phosphate deaminase [Bacteroidales bacterium]|nr:glucosamine-6-phosphate deaminase [Bacteroidales bacterium]